MGLEEAFLGQRKGALIQSAESFHPTHPSAAGTTEQIPDIFKPLATVICMQRQIYLNSRGSGDFSATDKTAQLQAAVADGY